jgi:hypothetical protein
MPLRTLSGKHSIVAAPLAWHCHVVIKFPGRSIVLDQAAGSCLTVSRVCLVFLIFLSLSSYFYFVLLCFFIFTRDKPLKYKLHPLEIFSGSGQFIAYGWHEKAGRPYIWPQASPLDVSADSDTIPLVTRAQLDRFSAELFKVVPRRLQGQSSGAGGPQTIGERLAISTRIRSVGFAARMPLIIRCRVQVPRSCRLP